MVLGGGSGRARTVPTIHSGGGGLTAAIAKNTYVTGVVVVAQDDAPHGPSHIAPIAMQLFDAMASGAESTHTMTAMTAMAARAVRIALVTIPSHTTATTHLVDIVWDTPTGADAAASLPQAVAHGRWNDGPRQGGLTNG